MDHHHFARLVSIACHDLRTPLATVFGFARTLARVDLPEAPSRYVSMIEAASGQIGDLLEELSVVARIESGRFEPTLAHLDTLELARAAAGEIGEERVRVTGEGATIRTDEALLRRSVGQLARAALRHGGLDEVDLAVAGPELELGPLTRYSAPVVSGEELRELQAAAGVVVVEALGGSVVVEGERLRIRLPGA